MVTVISSSSLRYSSSSLATLISQFSNKSLRDRQNLSTKRHLIKTTVPHGFEEVTESRLGHGDHKSDFPPVFCSQYTLHHFKRQLSPETAVFVRALPFQSPPLHTLLLARTNKFQKSHNHGRMDITSQPGWTEVVCSNAETEFQRAEASVPMRPQCVAFVTVPVRVLCWVVKY